MRLKLLSLILLSLFGLAAVVAFVPAGEAQRSDRYQDRFRDRDRAGSFDYYALVLSWSPTYCAEEARPNDPQCTTRARPYAFVLHGLWPQYERGYPSNCRIGRRPFVPNRLISSMLDIMPSRRLIIHEYRKHGTCSGLSEEGYFRLSRQLYDKVRIPAQFVNPAQPMFVSPADVVTSFLRTNPKLRSDMLTVSCRGSGNRLREVKICFSREGQFRRCGSNEFRNRCRAKRMFVPPVRASAANGPKGRGPYDPSPLPGPRFNVDPDRRL